LEREEEPAQDEPVAAPSLRDVTSKAAGRISDAEIAATQETIRELNRVIQEASEKHNIPQESLVRAFVKDRGQQVRQESVWNVFQPLFAARNKMAGDTKVYSREEGEVLYRSLPILLCSFSPLI
jgi:hypothetical protein